jgi:hypothetical protein
MMLACAAFVLNFAQSPRRGGVKTDRRVVYPAQPMAAPQQSGDKVTDPTFGTEIMRVTDGQKCRSGGTSYSYWPTFNRDSTRLLVMCDGKTSGLVYDFDPEGFALGGSYEVPLVPNTSGMAVRGEDAIWSGADPDLLFAHTGGRLYSFNAGTRVFKQLADFTRLLSGKSAIQLSKSLDDDVFAFTLKDAAYKVVGYAVYRRSANAIIHRSPDFNDEVRVDKSGKYLFVFTGTQGPGKIEVQIVDLQTGTKTDLTDDAPDHAPGHFDVGTNMIVGAGNYLVGLTARSLSAPHKFTNILDLRAEKEYGGYHVSMLADDERWALLSFPPYTASGVFAGEVFQVSTDGSQRVRRLFHHRAAVASYYDSPRANISRDGRFVAFTSNMGDPKRRDLYVARITPAPPAPQVRPRRVP